MATVIAGTDATLLSTTAEGQLWSWLNFVQRAEGNPSINTLAENRITGQLDIDSGIFSGNWSLPCALVVNTDGSQLITANDYLPGVTFSSGEPKGTFKSVGWGNYGLELIEHIISLQLLANPTNRTPNVTATFNSNTRVYSGAFRLPFSIGADFQYLPTEFV